MQFGFLVFALRIGLVSADPDGYVCQNKTDIAGRSCDIGRYGNCKDGTCDLHALAKICDGMHAEHECNGFNSNGFMKRCVRASCQASLIDSFVVACTRVDVPEKQPMPAVCALASTTSTTTKFDCSGQKPPFDLPLSAVPEVDDWHTPSEEPAEAAALQFLAATSIGNCSARLVDPRTGDAAVVTVGSIFSNWHVRGILANRGMVVLEYMHDRWATMAFIEEGGVASVLRKPIGRLQSMHQPLYRLQEVDEDWYCKQNLDTHDWVGRIAANMSGGETTFNAASSVFAPNNDNGIFGNPEELNKWVLTSDGTVKTQDFPRGNDKSGGFVHVDLRQYLPVACPQSGSSGWPNRKGGIVGRHLRVIEQGFWDPTSGCGATLMAASPPATAQDAVSTAFVRITVLVGAQETVTYLRVRANQTSSEPLGVDELVADYGDFYEAILSQVDRWDAFVAAGASASLPQSDRRYRDMANALMTGYLNTFRGMTPEYGMGKFANEYNEFLPLDTLSLHEGLLEWGHHDISRKYLTHFFGDDVYMNSENGQIKYGVFGCDGDADYGRLISLYVKTARYSGDKAWASSLLPVIEKMVGIMLNARQASMVAHNSSSFLYGLALGSPEHDRCRSDRSYYFNVNVWMVRGLSDLNAYLQESSLTHDGVLEAQLGPAAREWRERLQAAADYTAVRRDDGSVFFLHPCVGSSCTTIPTLKPGGSESSCIGDGTCWDKVAQGTGRSWQWLPNYANFRFFSEALLAGVLGDEYEEAILDFRDEHHGTITGMTRFRDVLDDMPVLGYGWGLLSHDKVGLFHTLLAGHSANYLSRGTLWSTEQRQQQQRGGVLDDRWTNNCGDGGEYCSLCMVSAMPPAMWIRWMLVQEHRDLPYVHLARGAPKRWYTQSEPFGIDGAPTRFGVVSYSLVVAGDAVHGTVSVVPHPDGTIARGVRYTVRLISPHWMDGATLSGAKVTAGAAKLVTVHQDNSTAVFSLDDPASNFTFIASFGTGAVAFV